MIAKGSGGYYKWRVVVVKWKKDKDSTASYYYALQSRQHWDIFIGWYDEEWFGDPQSAIDEMNLRIANDTKSKTIIKYIK